MRELAQVRQWLIESASEAIQIHAWFERHCEPSGEPKRPGIKSSALHELDHLIDRFRHSSPSMTQYVRAYWYRFMLDNFEE